MNIIDKFYDYQKEAFDVTETHEKGIVIMPTGTGKTFVQAGIIQNDIKNNPGFRSYIVNAPRIMLSFQLLAEVYKAMTLYGITARYMAVHSGGMDQNELDEFRKRNTDIPYTAINSSTHPGSVDRSITEAKDDDLPIIFFSTYNSAIQIERGRQDEPINIVLNDEAHYLTQERFNLDFNEIETERKYFFTATAKETPSDEGFGMNNTDFYGERIYTMTPLDAINRGRIVRPRVHIVEAENGTMYSPEELDSNLGKLVYDSFEQHSRLITDRQSPKMLIAGRGTNDILTLVDSPYMNELIDDGVKFYAISSRPEVGSTINGRCVSRREFLIELQKDGANPNQKLIVIHYDILTEGIDISGLTGVLFLRNQRKSKFIQTFGRVARLDVEDRAKLELGEINPMDSDDLTKMNKPYAWVIIPTITHEDKDTQSNLLSLITELRDYDFDPVEDIEPNDRGKGKGDEDVNDIIPTNDIRRITGQIITEFEARIEEERIASMTLSNQISEQELRNLNINPDFNL